jgi:hypothetical protein
MNARISVLAIVLLALTPAAHGQITASPQFFLNGTDWKDISSLTTDTNFIKALKVYTIEGVFDGLTGLLAQDGSADFPQNTKAVSDIIPHLAMGQIIDALDVFYLETKNANVPMMLALPIIARQASGASRAQIQTMTETARSIATELAASKTLDDFAKISKEIIAANKAALPQAK